MIYLRKILFTPTCIFRKILKAMLFEIFIDTKKPNGVFDNNGRVLYKMKALQKQLENYPG